MKSLFFLSVVVAFSTRFFLHLFIFLFFFFIKENPACDSEKPNLVDIYLLLKFFKSMCPKDVVYLTAAIKGENAFAI